MEEGRKKNGRKIKIEEEWKKDGWRTEEAYKKNRGSAEEVWKNLK